MTDERGTTAGTRPPPTAASRRPAGPLAWALLSIALLVLVTWQLAGVADDSQQLQVLDPDLAPVWRWALLAGIGVAGACAVAAWVRRGWTMPLAVVNAAANGATAALVVVLTVEDALFAPAFLDRMSRDVGEGGSADLRELFLLLVVVTAVWDSVDAILRARRRTVEVAPPTPDDRDGR